MADEATILINADGTYADASPSALSLLGVELPEFLGMAPGSFSPEPPDLEADRAFTRGLGAVRLARSRWRGHDPARRRHQSTRPLHDHARRTTVATWP